MAIFQRYLNVGARLTVGQVDANGDFSNPLTTVVIENIDGRGILMEWEVEKYAGSANDDSGNVRITNLSSRDRKKIQNITKLKGFNVDYEAVLEIGWDKTVVEVLRGDVNSVIPDQRDPTDVVTEFSFGAATQKKLFALSILGAEAQAIWLNVFKALANEMNCTLSRQFIDAFNDFQFAANNADDLLVSINLQDADPQDNFDVLLSSMGPQYDWSIQNGNEIFLLKGGFYQSGVPSLTLTPGTGLLQYTTSDEGGYQISALANPSVVSGQNIRLISLDGVTFNDDLWVDSVKFSGSTNGDSTMEITARGKDIFA